MSMSLSRGIDILSLVNHMHAILPSDVVKQLGIPRPTVYRILDTLVEKGLLYKHESDGRYRMTTKVDELNSSFSSDDRLAELCRPLLNTLTEQLAWPVAFSTIEQGQLVVRENTYHRSPLAVERFDVGYKMSVFQSASGICIMAFMKPEEREAVLEFLNFEKLPSLEKKNFLQELIKVKKQGYAIFYRQRKTSDMTSLAVPVVSTDHAIGAITVQYARTAIKETVAIDDFTPSLRSTAETLMTLIDDDNA